MKTESASSPRWITLLGAAVLGAAGMYFSDPMRGRRRRALLQDQMRHLRATTARGADVTARDLSNRLTGMQARLRRLLSRRSAIADDDLVVARVRAKLGRVVSHPHAIEVAAQQGQVSLRGPVLAHETDNLLRAVRAVPGVIGIDDRLQAYKRQSGVSSLQGGSARAAMRSAFMQENWTPALRGAALAGSGALAVLGLMRRQPAALALVAAGVTLAARALSNRPVRRLTGYHAGNRAVDLQKTIDISASPQEVWDAWANYENFPRFMSHVLEVRDLGDLRSHWVVRGPMGARIEWNAGLTECKRPSVIDWKSEPGAVVEHGGIVRFDPSESGTRVTVRLSYNPPAGALGHGVAVLLGSDPKREMDDDLMRMKSFIETGILPRDAAQHGTVASRSLH